MTDPFTEAEYSDLLALAASRYDFVDLGDLSKTNCPSIVWRHDIDYSPHRALRMAEIEHEQGLQGVYHVMLASRYYNAFEPEIVRILQKIAALGHHIGLHFDLDTFGESGKYAEEEIERQIRLERDVLESLCRVTLTSMSFHNYTLNAERLLESEMVVGLPSASTPSFFKNILYVSDSNGMWRYQRLRDVLKADPVPRLMVLTHPEWWTPEPMTPYQRLERCISGRADNNLGAYIRVLVRDGRLTPIAERAGLPADQIQRFIGEGIK